MGKRRSARAVKATRTPEAAREAEGKSASEGASTAREPDDTRPPSTVSAPAAAPMAGTGADRPDAPAPLWIEGLAKVMRAGAAGGRPVSRTTLGCHVAGERSRLFVPPEMPSLQPASLNWLLRFAGRNGFSLVEERRARSQMPEEERRSDVPPAIALGLSLLLRQTGLPGPVPRLSVPHRHAADAPFIDLPELVAMAASAAPRSKRVTILPNRPLVEVLGGDTRPVHGYACKLDRVSSRTVLSHFEAPELRCIGYSTGHQYVVHLLLGGGPALRPALWTPAATLARTGVRFRLFRAAKDSRMDFGLLYSTFYFDMTARRPAPWWLGEQAFTGARPTSAAAAPESLAATA